MQPDRPYLADPAEVVEPAQVCILHRTGRRALRCHQQARIVQLSRQPGLNLWVLPYEVPAYVKDQNTCIGAGTPPT